MTPKDHLFADADFPKTFVFDEKVAAVFDDMLERSIPLYQGIQALIVRFGQQFAKDNTAIYDLGCSTGITVALLDHYVNQAVALHGIDYSEAMLEKAAARLDKPGHRHNLHLVQADLNTPFPFQPSSMMILNLVLQFIAVPNRLPLLRSIYESLLPGGALILIEKIRPDVSHFDALFVDIYHEFKQNNGYSEEEIKRKQAALKDTLIPLSLEENKSLLKEAGFTQVTPFFQWVNFAGILAKK
jgi:tRNA (cmo5U34)-methyltransferase